MAPNTPTVEQAESLSLMAQHFNGALFDGAIDLSNVIICWTRAHQVLGGHLATNKWEGEPGPDGKPRKLHELAVNANVMKSLTITELSAIMVHELQHLHDVQNGKAGRPGYHPAHFCERMASYGLPQRDYKTGEPVPAGKGSHSCDNIIVDGNDTPFQRALLDMPEDAVPPYSSDPDPEEPKQDQGGGGEGGGEGSPEPAPAEPERKPGSRAKYTCVSCGLNAWAKPGALLLCGCNAQALIEQK